MFGYRRPKPAKKVIACACEINIDRACAAQHSSSSLNLRAGFSLADEVSLIGNHIVNESKCATRLASRASVGGQLMSLNKSSAYLSRPLGASPGEFSLVIFAESYLDVKKMGRNDFPLRQIVTALAVGATARHLLRSLLAAQLGAAEESVSRWETGAQVQSRGFDRQIRLFFALPLGSQLVGPARLR